MNKSIVAGAALLVAAAIAMPLSAWSAGDAGSAPVIPPQAAPTPPPPAPAGPARPGWGRWQGHGAGPMMGARAGGPQMMWRRRMMRRSPRQMCEQRLAHHAARVAYITSLLDLTPAQRPLLDKVRSAMEAVANRQHQFCATLKPADQRGEVTVLDRLARREQVLEAHLQALQQVQPTLQALYQALTPAQKAIIDRPSHRG